ncbi:hypothetical protein [Enterococcus phage vB_Efs10_KEN05]
MSVNAPSNLLLINFLLMFLSCRFFLSFLDGLILAS